MKDTLAHIVGIALLVVTVALLTYAPDAAFLLFFALLGVAAPIVVVAGAVRWIVKKCKGGRNALSE